MLRRFALLAGILAILGAPTEGRPTHGGAATISTPCNGVDPNDGCSALYVSGLQGTAQYSDLFTNTSYGPQNGQAFTVTPSWNVAGQIYPVGVPDSYVSAGLKDPAISGVLTGTGCTYAAFGATWGTLLAASIEGSGNLTFTGGTGAGLIIPKVQLSGTGVTTGTTVVSGSGTSWVVSGQSGAVGPITITIQGGPSLTCQGQGVTSGTNQVSLDGFEFGEVGGGLASGGHDSTVVRVGNTSGSTITDAFIRGNHFYADENTANFSNTNGSTGVALNVGTNYSGVLYGASLEFLNNTLDGRCFSSATAISPNCPGGNFSFQNLTYGAITERYNFFNHVAFRQSSGCPSASGGVCTTMGDLTMEYNLWFSWCPACTNAGVHGEVIEQLFSQSAISTQANTKYRYNTVTANLSDTAAADSVFYISGGATPWGPPIYANVLDENNTFIGNCENVEVSGSGASGCPVVAGAQSYPVTSAYTSYQNDHLKGGTIKNNYLGLAGTLTTYRMDCLSQYSSGVSIDNTGLVTASSFIPSGGSVNQNNPSYKIYGNTPVGSTKMEIGGVPSEANYIIAQQTSTLSPRTNFTGVTWTNNTMTYTGATSTGNWGASLVVAGDFPDVPGISPAAIMLSCSGCTTTGGTITLRSNTTSQATAQTMAGRPPYGSGTYTSNYTGHGNQTGLTVGFYGAFGQAYLENGPSSLVMSGNKNMVTGASLDSFTGTNSFLNGCNVPTVSPP